ncbi:YrzI family small protein [Bacillus atrophaeus]|nr:YrzI family small protein [Bacillus atrophaeus]MCY9107475.1 YrzI family small protein [Bacillus atrophaeus]MED4800723.1 YrzI family small protein [Bacillus atrophaeus]
MTINLFFLTLTIKKRRKSLEEYEQEQQIERFYNETKETQLKHLYLTNSR